MATKFKLVKHRFLYHVIGYTGTQKPRNKGGKITYKEQCISSHVTKNRAKKALDGYEAIKLQLSNKPEPKTFRGILKELHFGFWVAVLCGIAYELVVKTYFH